MNEISKLLEKYFLAETTLEEEKVLADYFRANDMDLKVLTLGTAEETLKAYEDRKCEVLTSDVSQLYAERLKLSAPDAHIILPEVISKEPLGPAVRQGDDAWFNLTVRRAILSADRLAKSTVSFALDVGVRRSWVPLMISVGTLGSVVMSGSGAAVAYGQYAHTGAELWFDFTFGYTIDDLEIVRTLGG